MAPKTRVDFEAKQPTSTSLAIMPEYLEDGNLHLLKEVVLCSTSLSLDLRNRLTELAESMGAIHRLDLTVDVTHLIVGNINTPKCKHTAKERPDIRVLKPDWIHAMRELFLNGEDIDVDALVHEHRLPVFHNLNICVTGFEDIDERQHMIEEIEANGAHYHGDLTREVTHLVVANPRGAKYERAKAWGLNVVSLKWFHQSLERGMALDESLYNPLVPLEDQGKGAFIRGGVSPLVLGKRQRESSANRAEEDAGKRKLRRTASTKLANHSQNMMTSFFSVGEEEPQSHQDQWTEPKDGAAEAEPRRNSTPLINDISRPASGSLPVPQIHEDRRLFSRVLCLVHGHDVKMAGKIEKVITRDGGHIATSPDELSLALDAGSHDHIVLILPSEWTSTNRGPVPAVPPSTLQVTEWWLERCLKHNTILDPDDDVLSRSHLDLPIDGFEHLRIATSGMAHDVLHVSKVVKLAGASYDERLVPQTSVLVMPTRAEKLEKISYAAKHKIAVVTEDWLFRSLRDRRKLPFERFPRVQHKQEISNHPQLFDNPVRGTERVPPPKQQKKFDMPAERLSAIRTRTPANCLTLFHHPPNRPVPQQRTMPTKKAPFIEEDEEEEVAGRVEAEGNDNNMVPAQPDSPPPPYVPDEIVAETDALPSVQPIPPEVSAGRIESKAIPAALIETHSTASSSLQGDAQDGSKSGEGEKTDVQSADAEYNAKQVRLNGDIQFLLDHRRSAVAAAASASPVEQTTGARRRRGGLGRAPSSNSMPGPFTMFQQISMDAANAPDSAPPAHPLALEDVETVYDEEVTYDTKDAQVQREKMSAMLGTDVGNNSTRTIVPSVGRVRDTGSFADDGRRIMRKRRPKSKNPSD